MHCAACDWVCHHRCIRNRAITPRRSYYCLKRWSWIIMSIFIVWMFSSLVNMSPTQAVLSSGHMVNRNAVQVEANFHERQPLPPLGRPLWEKNRETRVVSILQAESGNDTFITPEDKIQRLLNSAMSTKEDVGAKPHVLLVIVVPSIRPGRRQAIRDTWLNWKDDRVVLRFFTERPATTDVEETATLAAESRTHGDIVQFDIERGMNFGLKLLKAMRWMFENYTFDFFLRLDDDYFLCLRRLLDDIDSLHGSSRYQSPFISGSLACSHKGAYIDEAYMLIPSQIIYRVLSTPDLRCGSFGALTAAAWFASGGPCNREGDVQWVNDDRLNYGGSWWETERVDHSMVCQHYMGVHRTYQRNMYKAWALHPNTSGPIETFIYEDKRKCPYAAANITEARLERDFAQPCDSFTVPNSKIWCGVEGC